MTYDFSRFLGWSLTLQNFAVTALVAWALALLMLAHAAFDETVHATKPNQMAVVSHDLGFVGMATAPMQPSDGHRLLASGTPGRASVR